MSAAAPPRSPDTGVSPAGDAPQGLGRRAPLFIGLATAGFALMAVIYMGVDLTPLSIVQRFLVAEAVYVAPMVVVIVAGIIAARVSQGTESRFWLLLTGVNVTLLISECYYIWWVALIDVRGPPPVYLPFQVLHVIGAVLFLSVLVSMTRFGSMPLSTRIRYGLDVAAVMVVVFIAILKLVVDPAFAGLASVTTAERIAGAAYPVWGLVMLGGAAATLLGFKRSKWRPWEKLVTAALAIYGFGTGMWPVWLIASTEGNRMLSRGAVDLFQILGFYLLSLAALYRLTARGSAWPLRPMPLFQPASNTGFTMWVPVGIVMTLPVIGWTALSVPAGSADYWILLAVATVLALLIVSRTTLLALENGRVFRSSVTDPLTGLFAHSLFHERLAIEADTAMRYGEDLTLLVTDLDGLESVNAMAGHVAGDEMLATAAAALRAACRPTDTLCRIGADEFGVILPATDTYAALEMALAFQESLRRVRRPDGRRQTVSIGIAALPEHARDAAGLMRCAAGARYWARTHGRDQAAAFDADVVKEFDPADSIRTLEEESHLETVRALASAVDARDPATQFHSRNVAAFAVQVARELGVGEERVHLIEAAALMHDVGKIGIAEEVLRKPSKLTEAERAAVRAHSELGARIIAATPLESVQSWVRHHHEWWDGTGYPDGLRAVAIPLEARILAVCDAYDAMTSVRPYRPCRTVDGALAELVACSGTQFDPSVVEVFVRLFESPASPDEGGAEPVAAGRAEG